MKKGMFAILLLSITLLTGCCVEQKLVINSDFSSTVDMDMYTTKEEETAIMRTLSDMGMSEEIHSYADLMKKMEFTYRGAQMVNGVWNNIYTGRDLMSAQETKSSFAELSMERAVYDISGQAESASNQAQGMADGDINDMEFFYMTITYPFAVGKANGAIQADGYTVKYDVKALLNQKENRLYAISKSALAAADKITIQGVKDKKAYRRAITVRVDAQSAVTAFTVNGKQQPVNRFSTSQDGKYKIVVKSATGLTKKISFCIDKKKPTTNIKNKKTYNKTVKITFKDKISGIKKATLNGKKIKSGKRVKKNGKYTLKIYDKAGNVKTVKFTIKK